MEEAISVAQDAPQDAQPRARSSPARWVSAVRDALSGRHHDYTSGSLSRAIWLLAIPMVLEMAMESVFAVCDVFWVSRLGDAAVAAVGLTEAMLTIVYALSIGIAMSATAVVARHVGAKEIPKAVQAGAQAIYLGLAIGAAIGIPCAFFGRELLGLMGAPADVVAIGHGYTAVLLGTNVVILLLFLNNAIFRGAGDAAIAMRALWLANGINLLLDPCLIFGLGPFPELGITGGAIATSIGRFAGVVYQFRALRSDSGRVVLKGPMCRFSWPVMAHLLGVSVGGVAQFLIATSSWVVLMRLVAPFGAAALAGYTIAIRIIVFMLLPAFGLSNAAATMVGQNLGARRPDRAERAVWITGVYNMAFLTLVAVVFYVGAPLLVRPFASDNETIRIGVMCLRILSIGYPCYSWGMVMMQAFNGAGRTMVPTWMNLFCFWAVEIPLAWALADPAGLGPQGVFWSVVIAETLLAFVSVMLFRLGWWK
jgi:putative MATE family efflux protein